MTPEIRDFLKVVGKNIRTHQKAKRMTLQQMSKAVGVHTGGLALIERGEKDSPILIIFRIAECLKVNVKELL